ncbi:MAG: tetratricopeptide repeat protein [Planctomycetaceae bacterium]|nr:tetratricopeptide repeat protein [Planctomycetaceae bacterium]
MCIHRVIACCAAAALALGAMMVQPDFASAQSATAPASQPATAPASRIATQPAPLPPRALLGLDDILPPVQRPAKGAVAELPARAAAALKEAQELLERDDPAAALVKAQRAEGFAPDHPGVLRVTGLIYRQLKNPGSAIKALTAAAAADGDDLDVQLALGRLALLAGNRDEALLRLRTAVKCSQATPDNPLAGEAMRDLAAMLEQQGYSAAALQCWDMLGDWFAAHPRQYADRAALKYLATRPERLQAQRGTLMMKLRKYPAAAEEFRKAYERDRSQGQWGELMIEALAKAGDYPRAAKALAEMADEPSLQSRIEPLARRVLAGAADGQLLQRLWQEHSAGGKLSVPYAMALARAAQTAGDSSGASQIARAVLKQAPRTPAAAVVLASAAAKDGSLPAAVDVLVQALGADPGAAEAVAQAAAALTAADVGELDRTLARQAVADKSPARPAMHYVAGQLAIAAGRKLLAADQFQRAMDVKADYMPACEALAGLYLDQRQFDKVDRLVERIARQGGNNFFRLLLRGRLALARGDMGAAVELLKEAHALNARDVQVLMLLAEAQLRCGEQAEAISLLNAAVVAAPDNIEASTRLIRLLMDKGDHDAAGIVLQHLMERHGDDTAVRLMQVELALLTGRHNPVKHREAMALLESLRREQGHVPDVQLLVLAQQIPPGAARIEAKEFDRIVGVLNAILRDHPRHLQAARMMATLFARQGRLSEAVAIWQQLHREHPDRADIAQHYVQAMVAARQFEAAAATLNDILARSGGLLWAKLKQIEVLQQLSRLDEAIERGEAYLKRASGNSEKDILRQVLIKIYNQTDRFDDAQRLLDGWLDSSPEEPLANRLRGEKMALFCKARQFDKAETFARTWAAQSDDTDRVYLSLLQALQNAKEYDKANELVDKWLTAGSLREADFFRRFKLQLLVQNKQFDKLVEFGRKWVSGGGGDQAIFTVIGALNSGKVYDHPLIDEWIQLASPSVASLLRQIKIDWYCKDGKIDQAVAYTNALLAGDRWQIEPRQMLIGGLVKADQFQRAEKQLDDWLTQLEATVATQPALTQPGKAKPPAPAPAPGVLLNRGTRLLVVFTPDKILAWHRQMLVRTILMQNQHARGVERAKAFLEKDPNDVEMLSVISLGLAELGRPGEARAALEKALTLEPDDPALNNNLGYQYADEGVELAKAERMIRKSLAERRTAASLDSLGWLRYKQGMFDQAKRILDQALQDMAADGEEHAVIHDHLGDACARLGLMDLANRQWIKALELAQKEKFPSAEMRGILKLTLAKIEAIKAGKQPTPAPLGKGVAETK